MLKRYLNFFIIIAILALPAAVFAAWRDAPAAPPNYGATSPDTQADYKPVNLGDTVQTKTGGLNIIGNVGIGTTAPAARLHSAAASGGTDPAVFTTNDFDSNAGKGSALLFRFGASSGNTYASLNAYSAGYGALNNLVLANAGGNVGVAQTSPAAKLAVNNPTTVGKVGSSGDSIYAYANSANAAISADQASSTGYAIYSSGGQNYFSGNVLIQGGTSKLRLLTGRNTYIQPSANSSDAHIFVSQAGAGDFNSLAGDLVLQARTQGTVSRDIIFAGSGTGSLTVPLVTIKGTGNVGIGTTTPAYKLDVQSGQINASGGLCIATDCKTSWAQVVSGAGGVTGSGNKNYLARWAASGTTLQNSIIYDDGVNVGIGTSSPMAKLDIYRGSGSNVYDRVMADVSTASFPKIYFGDGASYNSYIGYDYPSTERMVLNSRNGASHYEFKIAGVTKMSISSIGDINIDGSGTAVGGWFVSSDARLKKNVETLSGALEKVGRIRGVSYDLVSGTSTRQIGVIAQELEQEFPELVKTDDKGYKAVAYDRLSAVLIEAVKELRAQNQTLQQRLDLLEKK